MSHARRHMGLFRTRARVSGGRCAGAGPTLLRTRAGVGFGPVRCARFGGRSEFAKQGEQGRRAGQAGDPSAGRPAGWAWARPGCPVQGGVAAGRPGRLPVFPGRNMGRSWSPLLAKGGRGVARRARLRGLCSMFGARGSGQSPACGRGARGVVGPGAPQQGPPIERTKERRQPGSAPDAHGPGAGGDGRPRAPGRPPVPQGLRAGRGGERATPRAQCSGQPPACGRGARGVVGPGAPQQGPPIERTKERRQPGSAPDAHGPGAGGGRLPPRPRPRPGRGQRGRPAA